jgi:hypothetical protein
MICPVLTTTAFDTSMVEVPLMVPLLLNVELRSKLALKISTIKVPALLNGISIGKDDPKALKRPKLSIKAPPPK